MSNIKLRNTYKSYTAIFVIGILVGCICRLLDYFPADTLWSFSSPQTLFGFWIITNTIIVMLSTSNICAGRRVRAADRTARTGRYSAIARSCSRRWLCSCSLDSYHHSSKRMVFFRLQLRYAALPEIVRGAALLLFRPNSTIMEKTKLLEVWLPWYENSFAR